jgi:hypothetical protein
MINSAQRRNEVNWNMKAKIVREVTKADKQSASNLRLFMEQTKLKTMLVAKKAIKAEKERKEKLRLEEAASAAAEKLRIE